MRATSRSLGRLVCFDAENRPLAYWYDGQTTSEITAFGWKWRDEPDVSSLVLLSNGRYEDRDGKRYGYERAHRLFGDVLESAGIVYGHNIRRHDLPILQAWRQRLGLPRLAPVRTTDTCRDLPKRKDMSVSLANLATLYGLPLDKKMMAQPTWERANQLRADGIADTRERVESDVFLQEMLRDELLERGLLGPPKVWAA